MKILRTPLLYTHCLHVLLFPHIELGNNKHFPRVIIVLTLNFKETFFTVENVQSRGGFIIFFGTVEGTMRIGDELFQEFDEVRIFFI